jgi:TusA-related sulfurtransferase
MSGVRPLLADTEAPSVVDPEVIDVRDLPPPEPLKRTLERLADGEPELLVQVNDRAPQHLFPRLDDRGYAHATVEDGDRVVTAIWPD